MNLTQTSTPTVHLVGAGPGDPELLTLKAARTLREADVILCDDLVDPRVLEHASPSARVLYVGKRGGCPSTDQRFIHRVMIREARSGMKVVRLKGGDPFVFGRGGEEADALRQAGLQVEVVSGLTAGLAGPASIGLPTTDRRHTPGVALVTGHAKEGSEGPNWTALAQSGLTLVIYMGVARAEHIVQALIEGGLSPHTPAAIIGAAHTPQQRQAVCVLDRLVSTIAEEGLVSPALLVIGDVVRVAPMWEERATQVGLKFLETPHTAAR
ncbi:MAG: uroporphyrinogen-III C-methyltransferase [Burkholderiaceae bacterium]